MEAQVFRAAGGSSSYSSSCRLEGSTRFEPPPRFNEGNEGAGAAPPRRSGRDRDGRSATAAEASRDWLEEGVTYVPRIGSGWAASDLGSNGLATNSSSLLPEARSSTGGASRSSLIGSSTWGGPSAGTECSWVGREAPQCGQTFSAGMKPSTSRLTRSNLR